jgi:hypothetical protein
MSDLCRTMQELEWIWGDKDPNALAALEQRIAETGRQLALITYSDLVKGIDFRLPNLTEGKPYRISIYDWSGLDRRILGDFLGYMSMRSYCNYGFMASALAVNRMEYMPSELFFEWMVQLQVLPDTAQDTVFAFWADQVHKAHNWYNAGR